jgi:hypothetical protein
MAETVTGRFQIGRHRCCKSQVLIHDWIPSHCLIWHHCLARTLPAGVMRLLAYHVKALVVRHGGMFPNQEQWEPLRMLGIRRCHILAPTVSESSNLPQSTPQQIRRTRAKWRGSEEGLWMFERSEPRPRSMENTRHIGATPEAWIVITVKHIPFMATDMNRAPGVQTLRFYWTAVNLSCELELLECLHWVIEIAPPRLPRFSVWRKGSNI